MTTRRQALGIVPGAALVLLAGGQTGQAASAPEIEAGVNETLARLFGTFPGTRELANRAFGILIFPTIVKAGIGIGGEYGEGALRIRGRTVGYFNTASASIGFQLGAQARSTIIMFMTPDALASFQAVDGWKIGIDGSVAIIMLGTGGSFDSSKVVAPIVGFVLDPKGLMYNLTLEGSKISRIYR